MWNFDEDSFITLTDEQGNEVDFLLLDVLEYKGADYLALLPLTDETEDDEEALFFLLSEKDEQGERYSSVTDEALLQEITAAFEQLQAENLRVHGFPLPDPEEP